MTKGFKRFYKTCDKYNFYGVAFAIVATILSLSLFIINYSKLPSKIPLFYSLPWGEPQLVTLSQFLILPLVITLIIIINLSLSIYLHPSQMLLKRIINLSTALIALTILITSYKIIYIFI